MSRDFPEDLRYTEDHEWVRVDQGGKLVTLGITEFAVEELGDITQVDLPKEGDDIRAGEAYGSVESVKAVSDIYSPLSGKVVKVNDPVRDTPETLNEDCYDEGWLIQIEVKGTAELEKLMDAGKYEQYLKDKG